MGRIAGYSCDRPECTTIVLEVTDRPRGWLTLDPHAGDGKTFELCSNKCVRLLALERERAERDARPSPRSGTDMSRKAAAAGAAGLIRWHRAGKHADPVEGCPECEAATAPEAANG
jgi:hypothetical protein